MHPHLHVVGWHLSSTYMAIWDKGTEPGDWKLGHHSPGSMRSHLGLAEILLLKTPQSPQHSLSLPRPRESSKPAWQDTDGLRAMGLALPPNSQVTQQMPSPPHAPSRAREPFLHFQSHLAKPKVGVGSDYREHLRRRQGKECRGHTRPAEVWGSSCSAGRCIWLSKCRPTSQTGAPAGFHKVLSTQVQSSLANGCFMPQ